MKNIIGHEESSRAAKYFDISDIKLFNNWMKTGKESFPRLLKFVHTDVRPLNHVKHLPSVSSKAG